MTSGKPANLMRPGGSGGLIIDTNLLLLLVVGSSDQGYVLKHKRVQGFGLSGFQRLVVYSRGFGRLVTTPKILTEVSNLLGQSKGQWTRELFASFAEFVRSSEEVSVPSLGIAGHQKLSEFGLTDLGIAELAGGRHVVLTDDSRLVAYLTGQGVDAVDFRWLT